MTLLIQCMTTRSLCTNWRVNDSTSAENPVYPNDAKVPPVSAKKVEKVMDKLATLGRRATLRIEHQNIVYREPTLDKSFSRC